MSFNAAVMRAASTKRNLFLREASEIPLLRGVVATATAFRTKEIRASPSLIVVGIRHCENSSVSGGGRGPFARCSGRGDAGDAGCGGTNQGMLCSGRHGKGIRLRPSEQIPNATTPQS